MKKIGLVIITTLAVNLLSCSQEKVNVQIDFADKIELPYMDSNHNLDPLVGFLISMPDQKYWNEYVAPLKVNFWRTNEWSFEKLEPLLLTYPDLHLQLVLGDQFPRKTYNRSEEIPFDGYSTWLKTTNNLLDQIPAKYYSRISIDIYNEPNSEKKWPNSLENFNRFFCNTISYINKKYPELAIAGPSTEGEESYEIVENTLEYMLKWKEMNSDLPLRIDQLSIHALGQSPRKCINDIPKYKSLLTHDSLSFKLGIKHIIYNEYCNRNQTDFFADAVRMLEAFEKEGVKYASRACWGTCTNGSLDNLLEYQDNQIIKKENWFGYMLYSKLDGHRYNTNSNGEVSIIAGSSESNKIALVANYTNTDQQINLDINNIEKYHVYQLTNQGLSEIESSDNYLLKKKQVFVIADERL